MDTAAEKGIALHIGKGIVHPAHIPFEGKAQAVIFGGSRYLWKSCRLLGDGNNAGIFRRDPAVHLLQQGDRLQVVFAAFLVGEPFPFLPSIVQIEHGSHSVYPQPIDMVVVDPIDGGRDKKAPYLGAAVIEDHGAPVGMFPFPGIGVFVTGFPIKIP